MDALGIITAEAALAFVGISIIEPTPDWGRMVQHGATVYLADPTDMFVPAER